MSPLRIAGRASGLPHCYSLYSFVVFRYRWVLFDIVKSLPDNRKTYVNQLYFWYRKLELPMSGNAVEFPLSINAEIFLISAKLPKNIISRNGKWFSFTDIENRSIDESFTNIVNHNWLPTISVNQPILENRNTDIGKCYQYIYINFFGDVGRSQITDIIYHLAMLVNSRIFW